MSEPLHHDMGPSSLERRRACPGSLKMEKGQPDLPSEDSEEGTDYHSIVADAIKHGGDVICTAEQQELVNAAMDVVHSNDLPGAQVLVEHRVDLSRLGCGFGTVDYVAVVPYRRAIVIDWKFGHIPVPPAQDNVQLLAYAAGIALEFELSNVTIILAQLPLNRVSSLDMDEVTLNGAELLIEDIVGAATAPDAGLMAGDHCRYCKARAICPLLNAARDQIIATPAPEELTTTALGKLLHVAERAEAQCKALKARAYQILSAGGEVPGWHLEPGRKSRDWAEGAEKALAEIAKGQGKPEGIIYDPVTISSPAQMEKKLGKAALKDLIITKPGNPKLAPAKE